MSWRDSKPTPFYHLGVQDELAKGWKVAKHGTYHREKGTFLSRESEIVFIGWSGSRIVVPHADR